jgi:hypothetical protein
MRFAPIELFYFARMTCMALLAAVGLPRKIWRSIWMRGLESIHFGLYHFEKCFKCSPFVSAHFDSLF